MQIVRIGSQSLRRRHAIVGHFALKRVQVRIDDRPSRVRKVTPELAGDERHGAELAPERGDHALELRAPRRSRARRAVPFALMPEDALQRPAPQRDPRPRDGVRPEIPAFDPAVDACSANCAGYQPDGYALAPVGHRAGERRRKPRPGDGGLVEMYRLLRNLPFPGGVQLEYSFGGNAVGVRQHAAACHVRLPDEQVEIHVTLSVAGQCRGNRGGHDSKRLHSHSAPHHLMTIMIPGIVVTVKTRDDLTKTTGGSSLSEPAVNPPEPDFAMNLFVTLSQNPTALSDARFTGM